MVHLLLGETLWCNYYDFLILMLTNYVYYYILCIDNIYSTVHFWAPMSKWMISGASFLEYDRPTDKISLAQYSALTATGFFFSRYALLVTPINYVLW